MYLINKLYIFAVHRLVKVSGYVQSKWTLKGSKNAPKLMVSRNLSSEKSPVVAVFNRLWCNLTDDGLKRTWFFQYVKVVHVR